MKLKLKDIDSLAARIEEKRTVLGYSYSELARLSRVNQGQVSRICRGQFKTFSGNVMQICMLLGVSNDEEKDQSDSARIKDAVMSIWDGTAADADKITRLLSVVGEVKRG